MGTETALLFLALGATAAGVATTIKASKAAEKVPEPSPLPPAPEPEPATGVSESATVAAKAEEIKKRLRKTGRASTILTSPQGLLGEPTIARKTLLGE